MNKRIPCLVAFSFLICSGSLQADLLLNLNYSGFNLNAPASVNGILGGASLANARSTMDAAAAYWQNAFANSNSSRSFATAGRIEINIDVDWTTHGGSTLATGGPAWNPATGEFGTSTLNWDNDNSSLFFVDSTPYDQSEFTQSSFRSASQGGVSMNVERLYWGADYFGPLDGANSRSDMLSVAIHEIGHAIGMAGNYTFNNGGGADADPDNDGDYDITGGSFNGADIAYGGSHLSQTLSNPNSPGNDPVYTNRPGGSFSILTSTGFSANLGPSINSGTRKLLTEIDVATMGQVLGFDQSTINFNPQPVPEPTSLAMLGLGALLVLKRRRLA